MNEKLPNNIEIKIGKVLQQELQLFEFVNNKKIEMHLIGFDLYELFLHLDFNQDGYICENDIKEFLLRLEVTQSIKEIELIIDLYDLFIDAKWNWKEFLMVVLPSKYYVDLDSKKIDQFKQRFKEKYGEEIFNQALIQANEYEYNNNKPEKLDLNVYSLNNDTEIFIKELYNLILLDIDAESMKIALSNRVDFNLTSAFKFFDVTKTELISINEFQSRLQYFNIHPNLHEVTIMFKRYDKNYAKCLK